jgi:hypothetical protein
MYTTIGTYYSFLMTVCCPGSIGAPIISTNFCMHTVIPPMMGLDTPETCRG